MITKKDRWHGGGLSRERQLEMANYKLTKPEEFHKMSNVRKSDVLNFIDPTLSEKRGLLKIEGAHEGGFVIGGAFFPGSICVF